MLHKMALTQAMPVPRDVCYWWIKVGEAKHLAWIDSES